ncbi:TatD family like protein [Aduncisulcus paluster]|nr:TatD family like protein [Aduncisulcus paluster]
MKFIEIGGNMTDGIFHGRRRGVKFDDYDLIMERAAKVGVEKIIITVGSFREFYRAVEICKKYEGKAFMTCGIHPTRSNEITGDKCDPKYIERQIDVLRKRIHKFKEYIVAYGEFGLDYDRLHFSPKTSQLAAFKAQLSLASELNLPLFLHTRNAESDFCPLLSSFSFPKKGVVHSFTGTPKERDIVLKLGYDLSVNGCSFKKEHQLECVKKIPLSRLHLETDCPWCDIRSSHASWEHVKTKFHFKHVSKAEPGDMIKGRNEPCCIVQVVEVMSAIMGISAEKIADKCYENSEKMYFAEKSSDILPASSAVPEEK